MYKNILALMLFTFLLLPGTSYGYSHVHSDKYLEKFDADMLAIHDANPDTARVEANKTIVKGFPRIANPPFYGVTNDNSLPINWTTRDGKWVFPYGKPRDMGTGYQAGFHRVLGETMLGAPFTNQWFPYDRVPSGSFLDRAWIPKPWLNEEVQQFAYQMFGQRLGEQTLFNDQLDTTFIDGKSVREQLTNRAIIGMALFERNRFDEGYTEIDEIRHDPDRVNWYFIWGKLAQDYGAGSYADMLDKMYIYDPPTEHSFGFGVMFHRDPCGKLWYNTIVLMPLIFDLTVPPAPDFSVTLYPDAYPNVSPNAGLAGTATFKLCPKDLDPTVPVEAELRLHHKIGAKEWPITATNLGVREFLPGETFDVAFTFNASTVDSTVEKPGLLC